MKTFYRVTLVTFVIGFALLCCFVPWIVGSSSAAHSSVGYAPLWSQRFSAVPGAHVDDGGFAILAGAVAFLSIVIGAAAFFFRDNRGAERADV